MEQKTISNAEYFSWGNKCEGWHFLNREDISIIKERMPPNTSERMHLHRISRQFFYILSGSAVFNFQNKKVIVGPGEGIEIEPGEAHQIRNEGKETLDFILVSKPSTTGDRVNL